MLNKKDQNKIADILIRITDDQLSLLNILKKVGLAEIVLEDISAITSSTKLMIIKLIQNEKIEELTKSTIVNFTKGIA